MAVRRDDAREKQRVWKKKIFSRARFLQFRRQTIPHGWIDRSFARSLACLRDARESRGTVYITTPRARYIHGTNETRVRSPRSRARHWRAVAPGLLVHGATEQRRDARRHLVSLSLSLFVSLSFFLSLPPLSLSLSLSLCLGSGDVHPATQHRGHWISQCPPRSTMLAIGTPGARTVNQKNAR